MDCHSPREVPEYFDVLLVGNPNVGKSVIFHKLTGRYATVSNYPGTTVDISAGKIKNMNLSVADLPGMYSFFSITEEERVAKEILLNSKARVVVNVIDAKNIDRALPLTIQLIDACFNVILVLNAVDEAEKIGMRINSKELERKLGIPVVETIAIKGKGIKELLKRIDELSKENREKRFFRFSEDMEKAIEEVGELLPGDLMDRRRIFSILALANDMDVIKRLKLDEKDIERIRKRFGRSLAFTLAMEYQRTAEILLESVIEYEKRTSRHMRFDEITLNPLFAIPMSIAILYLLYLFTGVIGAQILVDVMERLFEMRINDPLNAWLSENIKSYWLRELVGGEYGVITLGLRYAISIVLPIVSMFFLSFSLLEDSGLLPRMAMLLDRLFKKAGLSGRAVIPLILGLGCGTMAVIVTRVLESRREKMIATLMLAVAIPCSAQLGIMIGIAPDLLALYVWGAFVFSILTAIGLLAGKYMPGEKPVFYMEIPPLRLPSFSNVLMKTISRLEWYFKEVIPIFVIISLAIWVGRITEMFSFITTILSYPASLLSLPEKMSEVFLYGFFRRDYGTAGLYDLVSKGVLDYKQTVVSMVVLTLFVPCIAQLSMMIKERGLAFALATFITSILIAFSSGFLLNAIFEVLPK